MVIIVGVRLRKGFVRVLVRLLLRRDVVVVVR